MVTGGDRVGRLFDVAMASIALLASLPLQVLIAGAVLVSEGIPIYFSQDRIGREGRPFRLVKFRTMSLGRDSEGNLLPDADRLTSLGRFLRRYSLDEIPELWNVLRGEMSLVGPRPLPVRYLPRYTATETRRHEVRPGITGLAQVSGRNSLGWEERLAMDVWYVDHRSFSLDLRILWRTLGVVLGGRGVGATGSETMSEFRPDGLGGAAGAERVTGDPPGAIK